MGEREEWGDGDGDIHDHQGGFKIIKGVTISYQDATLTSTSKYYQPHRSRGAISQEPGRRAESGEASQIGVTHWTPLSHIEARWDDGKRVVPCLWWPRMVVLGSGG